MTRLQWVYILLSVIWLGAPAAHAATLQAGSSYDEIKAVLGKPDGELNVGSKQILTYGEAKITLIDGKATSFSADFTDLLAERIKERKAIEGKRQAGLVNYKGEWITPEESHKRQLEQKRKSVASSAPVWQTNFAEASALARAQNKKLLMNFTGSDWCGWCIKLDKEVFSQREFLEEARRSYVLLKLDFPRRTKLAPALERQNRALQQKYRVRGYPTIVVLNQDGAFHKASGYVKGGPRAFLASIR